MYLVEYVRTMYNSIIFLNILLRVSGFDDLILKAIILPYFGKNRSDQISDRISESDIFQISEKSEIG